MVLSCVFVVLTCNLVVCVCVCVCVRTRVHACACTQSLSHVQLFVTPWTVAHQAPLSMQFSKQKYWSKLPFPTPGDLPDPGIKPASFVIFCVGRHIFTTEPPRKPNLSEFTCKLGVLTCILAVLML